MELMYARLSPGSRWSWLKLLAAGWQFSTPFCPEPMAAHHGRYAVLMTREVND